MKTSDFSDMADSGYITLDDLGYNPELAQALGEMIIAWANAETELQFVLSRAIGLEINAASTLYFHVPTFESRVKLIKAMLSKWDTDKYDPASISKAIGKLSSLAQTRNNWVHGRWAASHDFQTTVVFNMRAKDGSPSRRKSVKAHDVHNHVAAVNRWAERINKLTRK